MRRVIVLLVGLLLVAPLHGAQAAPPPSINDGTGPLDTAADVASMNRFEGLLEEHLLHGMVVPLRFNKWPHIDPNAVPERMEGEADSGNYTGVYLAAQSWRYSQAKAELKKLGVNPLGSAPDPSEVVAFWRAQRDEALDRSREIINYFHVLVNIARVWQTKFDPKIDTTKEPTEFGYIDFGGGIIPGEAGLLMRTCTRDDTQPAYADIRLNFAPTGDLIGPLRWEDGHDWYCVGSTSRDSYMGTVFGLAVALDFLATDENPELRATLGHDLMAMADYAFKYLWLQPRPHGTVANPLFGHNDLRGPISPLFIQAPAQLLHMLQTGRHAARVLGDSDASKRYELLWKTHSLALIHSGAVRAAMLVDAANPHNDYYKYQLNLMALFNTIRLEPDGITREKLSQALAVLDATLTDDGNAFFEAMMYGLTHERARLDEAVQYHREWLDYYAFHEQTARNGVTPFVHTGRCTITSQPPPGSPIEKQPLECVKKGRVEMILTLGARDIRLPIRAGRGEDMRSKDPLPVGVRRLADFLWQKDPTIIGGDHDIPWRGPSVDFLVSYWMLRYYSEVVHTEERPLTPWRGPRFA